MQRPNPCFRAPRTRLGWAVLLVLAVLLGAGSALLLGGPQAVVAYAVTVAAVVAVVSEVRKP